jgi:hypothetical protein
MQSETTQAPVIVMSREDIERWFEILEYLLFKATFFTLAAIGAYHLITRHGL